MDRGRVGVFLGYIEGIDKQFWIWVPNIKAKIKTSDIKFYKQEKGGDIDLRITVITTSNVAPTRRPVGRPPKQVEEEVQLSRRVFSHIEIPMHRPERTSHQDQIEMEETSTPKDAKQTNIQEVRYS